MLTNDDSISNSRVEKLACMQYKLLSHALSIPGVKVVLYSTCSLNTMENEGVVNGVLKHYGDRFELEDISAHFKQWKHFGVDNSENAKKVLRTDPSIDKCHGFFVAKFVAKESCNDVEINSFSTRDATAQLQQLSNFNSLEIHSNSTEPSDFGRKKKPSKRKYEVLEVTTVDVNTTTESQTSSTEGCERSSKKKKTKENKSKRNNRPYENEIDVELDSNPHLVLEYEPLDELESKHKNKCRTQKQKDKSDPENFDIIKTKNKKKDKHNCISIDLLVDDKIVENTFSCSKKSKKKSKHKLKNFDVLAPDQEACKSHVIELETEEFSLRKKKKSKKNNQ